MSVSQSNTTLEVIKSSNFNKLEALKAAIKVYENDKAHEDRLLDAFANCFDELLIDSEDRNNQYYQASTSSSLDEKSAYIQNVRDLQSAIEALDDASEWKAVLLERFHDNFSSASFQSLDKNLSKTFANKTKAIDAWFAENHVEDITNTVEVRTWGTRYEYGNGLRAVIDKNMKGDDVGHASVTMRIPADDKGLELIKKYCIHKSGAVLVPYEIKKYNNQAVYEIYWSYWPGAINTLKDDIAAERKGNEYVEVSGVEAQLPKELSDKYFLHKYRKGKSITLAPAATGIKSDELISKDRATYIKLKISKNKLNEEITSLEALVENYLAGQKMFEKSPKGDIQELRFNSNFIGLIRRFKDQFPDQSLIIKILTTHEISKEEARKLESLVNNLKDNKEIDREKAKEQIDNLAGELEKNRTSIKSIKSKLKKIRKSLNKSLKSHQAACGSTERVKELIGFFSELSQNIDGNSLPIILDRDIQKKYKDLYSLPNFKVTNQVAMVFETRKIKKKEDIKYIIQYLNQYDEKLTQHINSFDIKERDIDYVDQLHDFYQNQCELTDERTSIQEAIEKVSSDVLLVQSYMSKLKEKDESHKLLNEYLKLKQDIKNINSIKKSVKGGAKKKIYYFEGTNQIGMVFDSTLKVDEVLERLNSRLNILDSDIENIRVNADAKMTSLNLSIGGSNSIKRLKINSLNRAREMIDNLKKHEKSLTEKLERIAKSQKLRRLKSNRTTEDILKRSIVRGIPEKKSTLHGFDIKAMLKTASELAFTTGEFDLRNENCSTTSMKLLNAGAPDDMKGLFYWAKPSEGETYSDNAFLTNPQMVYSSARVCERVENGERGAKSLAKRIMKAQGDNKLFYKAINELAANENEVFSNALKYFSYLFNTYIMRRTIDIDEDELNIIKEDFNKLWSNAWQFIRHPSTVFHLISDYYFRETDKTKKVDEPLVVDINDTIKKLAGGGHHLISDSNPETALFKMLGLLRNNGQIVPFFSGSTLEKAEEYVLSLEANETLSSDELGFLEIYRAVLSERDARIDCIDNALTTGKDAKEQLKSRPGLSQLTETSLPANVLKQYKLGMFMDAYHKKKQEQVLSSMRPGVMNLLNKDMSVDDKLKVIEKNVATKQHSISAGVWQRLSQSDGLFKTAENKETQPSFSADVYKGSTQNQTPRQ